MSNSKETINFLYKFKFNNGTEKKITVALNKNNLDLIQIKRDSYPKWTELEYNKCSNCPLNKKKYKYCPAAKSLVELIESFKNLASYENVTVIVETEERAYSKETILQKGISSLLGIYMAASECPIMNKLKPMVRYHLPFATAEETKYRMISMYLFLQYFKSKKQKTPDWELKELVKIYDDIRIVNQNFCKRFLHIGDEDANVNSVIHLDCFAFLIPSAITNDKLEDIESLFKAYLE